MCLPTKSTQPPKRAHLAHLARNYFSEPLFGLKQPALGVFWGYLRVLGRGFGALYGLDSAHILVRRSEYNAGMRGDRGDLRASYPC